MLFKGNVKPLLRVAGAGALMGGVVWLLRDAAFLMALNDKLALLLLVSAGVIVYGVAAFLLGAISRGEARYVFGRVQNRLHRPGHKKLAAQR